MTRLSIIKFSTLLCRFSNCELAVPPKLGLQGFGSARMYSSGGACLIEKLKRFLYEQDAGLKHVYL